MFLMCCLQYNIIQHYTFLTNSQLTTDLTIVLSIFKFSLMFVITCGLFGWKLFVICLDFVLFNVVGDPILSGGGWNSLNRFKTATFVCSPRTRSGFPMPRIIVICLCTIASGDRCLCVLLMLVELLTITVSIFCS